MYGVVAIQNVFGECAYPIELSHIATDEFDIVITGNLGSGSVKWLIECRDRPSDGSAPASWIEQLVGRRDRFNFTQVTAVSTTGFAKPAVDFACAKGIELRTVECLAPEDVASWFGPDWLDVIENQGDLLRTHLILDPNSDPEAIELAQADLRRVQAQGLLPETKTLVHARTGKRLTIRNAWQAVINAHPELFEGLKPGDARLKTVNAHYPEPLDRYEIRTAVGPLSVATIVFNAELRVVHRLVPMSQIKQYSRTPEQSTIAQSVLFAFEAGDRSLQLAFHNLGRDDQTIVVLNTSDETRNDSVDAQ